jgi:hypothetical protein
MPSIYVDFSELKGKVIKKIVYEKKYCSAIEFHTDDKIYTLTHEQDCCEQVYVEDICGSLENLIGSPILLAEKVEGEIKEKSEDERILWTFYKLATIHESVTIRWYANLETYYSVDVDFYFNDKI